LKFICNDVPGKATLDQESLNDPIVRKGKLNCEWTVQEEKPLLPRRTES
jgi:hypothetical protein